MGEWQPLAAVRGIAGLLSLIGLVPWSVGQAVHAPIERDVGRSWEDRLGDVLARAAGMRCGLITLTVAAGRVHVAADIKISAEDLVTSAHLSADAEAQHAARQLVADLGEGTIAISVMDGRAVSHVEQSLE